MCHYEAEYFSVHQRLWTLYWQVERKKCKQRSCREAEFKNVQDIIHSVWEWGQVTQAEEPA